MSAPTRSRPPMDARILNRRREVARAAVRRRRRVTASVVAAVALVAGAVGLTYTPLFAVTDVRVQGATGERQDEVRSVAGVVVGERLLGIDLEAVAGDVTALPWVGTAEVVRQPPSTVEIRVGAREPVAVVRAAGAAWLVDADAVVVAGGTRDGIVEIDAPQAVLPGSGATVRDPAVRNALAAHQDLPPRLRRAVVRHAVIQVADVGARAERLLVESVENLVGQGGVRRRPALGHGA